jgi:hypothetical protein
MPEVGAVAGVGAEQEAQILLTNFVGKDSASANQVDIVIHFCDSISIFSRF